MRSLGRVALATSILGLGLGSVPRGPRVRPRATVLALLLSTIALGLAAAAPREASAAASVEGCFSYACVRYQTLSTTLLYAEGGYWHTWNGTDGLTDANGCVRYNIGFSYRRVRAT